MHLIVVGVVQLVERQFVVLVVAGSSPVAYPILVINRVTTQYEEALVAQLDRASDFGSEG